MRAKSILALILGAFVIVAIVTVAKQSALSAPPTDRPLVASALPLANPVPAAPNRAGTTAAVAAEPSSVVAASVPPEAKPQATGKAQASSAATAKVKIAPAERVAESQKAATARPTHVRKVVATYFHGNFRCVTCRKIEAYSKEAVQDAFDQQIENGAVEFRAVNVEEDANRHFIQDYQLVTRTLVVTEEVDGAVTRWAKLDNVWALVNDQAEFYRYVQAGVRDYLEPR